MGVQRTVKIKTLEPISYASAVKNHFFKLHLLHQQRNHLLWMEECQCFGTSEQFGFGSGKYSHQAQNIFISKETTTTSKFIFYFF